MMANVRFDGRVAIITGAGGGLGRTYALMLAERGCAVVVNDLGGGRHGEGRGSSMADGVVREIQAKGGKAIANYDSVEFGDRIVKTAVDNFGRIDIVINNAGILRDKAFINMTDRDWDLIHTVHLRGAYAVTKAAWPYMRKQKFGRVLVTSSNAGIYGNFGQANYAAAKLGLIGFAKTLAQEGAKYNICVNALVPTAGSRLTQTVMPEEALEALKPEFVTPLTVWLCHEQCDASGGVFEAAAGWFGQYQWYRSNGVNLQHTKLQPEDVRDNWHKIVDMNGAKNFATMDEVMAELMSVLSESSDGAPSADTDWRAKRKGDAKPQSHAKNDLTAAKNAVMPATYASYTSRDAIIYALGVGVPASQLQFVFEGHEQFTTLPTFPLIFGLLGIDWNNVPTGHFTLDPTKVLHGEQYLELYEPLPTDGKIRMQGKIVDILDKGSGASILFDMDTFDDNTGKKLSRAQFNIFHLGSGGFGGAKSSPAEKKIVPIPKRSPDAVIEQKTALNQAALYRMSGDLNPLHIDPSFSGFMGFKKPILHGLCTLAHAVRHILDHYAASDVNQFVALKARFSKPVIPGQTLQTETWKNGNRIHFQTKVKETGAVVVSGGYVDLKNCASTGLHSTMGATDAKSDVKSKAVFEELKKRLAAQPEIVQKVKGIFLWEIKKNGKTVAKYTVDLKNGDGAIYDGPPKSGAKANTTLTLDDDDMLKLVTGKLNPQQAFMSGKLKLKGNIMLTQKLQALIGDKARL